MQLPNSYYLKFAKNIYSQCGEDGIIEKIFSDLNITDGVLVEFGAWDGIYLSNIFNLWKNKNYKAILVESLKERVDDLFLLKEKFNNIEVHHKHVNQSSDHEDSIDNILSKSSFKINKDNFQLMSIDIDSCDYYIFESIQKYFPKIIIIETNTNYDPTTEYVSSNDGCSLKSICNLAEKKGYTLICHTGNAILLRNDLIDKIPNEDFSIDNLFVSTNCVPILQSIDFNGEIGNQIFWLTEYYNKLITETKNSFI